MRPICLTCWQKDRIKTDATCLAYVEQKGYAGGFSVIDWAPVCDGHAVPDPRADISLIFRLVPRP